MRKLMAHGTATNSIELSGDAKSFDRVARKWNVDYAFYKTGPDKYLLFFISLFLKPSDFTQEVVSCAFSTVDARTMSK